MAGPAILKVQVVSNAESAASGLSEVGSEAVDASRDVDRLGDSMEDAARKGKKLGDSAESVDEVGGAAGRSATGLNDLSGVFDLVGGGAGAFGEKMGIVATIMDAAAGAADLYGVAVTAVKAAQEFLANSAALATVKTVALGIAQRTVAIATQIWTAAQWLLNVAMSANPIGLIILAIVALIVVIILIVKNFDKLKAVAISVWDGIRSAISSAWNWLKTNVFDKLMQWVNAYINIYLSLWDTVKDVWGKIRKALEDNAVVKAIKGVIEWIQNLIDKFTKLKVPDWLTKINPFKALPAGVTSRVFALLPGPGARSGLSTQAATTLVQRVTQPLFAVTVVLDGKKVGGYVQRIIDDRLDAEGARLAAGAWG